MNSAKALPKGLPRVGRGVAQPAGSAPEQGLGAEKSAGGVSAAGGTECAGVPSEIDVQARYENVSLTHTAENGSDFRPRQCTSEIVLHGELLRVSCAIVARAPASLDACPPKIEC